MPGIAERLRALQIQKPPRGFGEYEPPTDPLMARFGQADPQGAVRLPFAANPRGQSPEDSAEATQWLMENTLPLGLQAGVGALMGGPGVGKLLTDVALSQLPAGEQGVLMAAARRRPPMAEIGKVAAAPGAKTVRLYRGEISNPNELPQWLRESVAQRGGNVPGRWFTTDQKLARGYANDQTDFGRSAGRVLSVEIPEADLPKYRARGSRFEEYAKLPDEEYVLPPKLARSAVEIEAFGGKP